MSASTIHAEVLRLVAENRVADAKLETIMLPRPDGARICVHRMRAPGPDLLLLGGYGRSSPLRKPIGATVLGFCKANRLGLAALEFRGQGGSSGALQRPAWQARHDRPTRQA